MVEKEEKTIGNQPPLALRNLS